jgi:uncharacterized protein with von Willebrand factor type A (vWA) domain
MIARNILVVLAMICAMAQTAGAAENAKAPPASANGGKEATAPTTKPAPKVSFMGVSDKATRIVFVCDSSGSMMTKFDSLREELRKAVDGLLPAQSMNIIYISEDAPVVLAKSLLPAEPLNKRKAYDFLVKTAPHGSTDPVPAMRIAFATKPQVIYLLTDGDFPNNRQLQEEIQKLNKDKAVKIHTIAFIDRGEEYEKLLKSIAEESGGSYRFVAEKDLEK